MDARPLAGLRIGVFGKGGAGKSTLTVLLARELAGAGYSTVVLDADSTNMGLSEALGAEAGPRPLLEHFGGMVFSGGAVTCPVDDPTPLRGSELDLDLLPHSFQASTQEGVRLLIAGKMGDLGPGAGCDGPIAKIARDLRVHTREEKPTLLIDFKAGFEDSARGVLTGLDWVLVVVDPTTASLHMAAHLHRMLRKIREGVPPATSHLEDPELADMAIRQFKESRTRGASAILNRVPDADMESYMRGKLGALGGPPILGVIPEDRGLQGRWLKGEEVQAPLLSQRARALVYALESLVIRDGSPVPA
jgi:CO dehydrogenase nickel-insertion accessory protein CooC1